MKRTQVVAGTGQIRIRQACAGDQDAIGDFLASLSLRSRYLRFFTGSSPASAAMLRILAGGGRDTDVLVATEAATVIGHAMAVDTTTPTGTRSTDVGVVVADTSQGSGVGSALMRALTARALARGVTAAQMEVLSDNRDVLAMIGGHWPAARYSRSGQYVTIHASLSPPRAEPRRPIPSRRSRRRSRPTRRRDPSRIPAGHPGT